MHRITWFVALVLAAAVPCVSAQPMETMETRPNNTSMEAMPLLIARQSLLVARSRVLELKYAEAVRPLLAAAQALAAFALQEPGPNGQSAEFTRQGIQDYAAVIEQDPGDGVRRVDDWMDRIHQWDR